MRISSTDFKHGQPIPLLCTCDGENNPPTLHWNDVPLHAKTLALICDDPDAPQEKPWVHWVAYNIPSSKESLGNLKRKPELEDGTMQGKNSQGHIGYDGPCPPSGNPHRYYFTLYALDTVLPLEPGATKEQLLQIMEPHIIAQANLMGTYKRAE